MQLKNAQIKLYFDDRLNNVTQLVNLVTGEDYIKVAPKKAIFELVAINEETQEKIILKPKSGKVSLEDEILVVNYVALDDGAKLVNVGVTVYFQLQEQEVHIWLNITNEQENIEIIEILTPNIQGIYLGQNYEDNIMIYPHHAGEKTINPIEQYTTRRYQEFWRAGTTLVDGVYVREINYCGLASMTWMYYYNNDNGLYIGSHDERFPVTGVRVETGGKRNPWMGFSYRKYHKIAYRETWDSKKYCIGMSCCDWHWGAQKYRKWINKHLNITPNPAYLKDEYALNQCYNFKKDGKIHNHFDKIPIMFEKGMQYGIRHVFLASWNRKGFDCNYPEYYPDMELGSAMDLCRGIKYINEHGGMSTFYINARLFDQQSDFYNTIGKNMAIRDEQNIIRTESYGPVKFSLCCPSDQRWEKYLVDTAIFTAKAYGAKGIYLDQLASAEPFACYAKNHSHADIGDFNNGYMRILKRLKEGLNEIDPNTYLMTENCGDIYGSYTWGNLTWNGTNYDEHFNVFKYTFPEYVLVNMVNPRAWVNQKEEKEQWFYKDMERAILLGGILWLGITSRFEENSYTTDNHEMTTKFRAYMQEALAFRKKINSHVNTKIYKDTDYITRIPENVSASVWESEHEIMIIMGNASKKENLKVCMVLPWQAQEIEVYNLSLKEENIGVLVDDKDLEITVSKDQLFFTIFKK
ncbi:MAG: DUF6259 domain-containing protein [Cellulosilyticaceae bacterium]